MKKNWMLFLFFAAISVFTFSACSDDDNDTPDASAVSNLVREAFNSKYPQARSVEWEVKGNYAVASFHSEGTSHEAWYNPSSAEWYMTESDIPYEALPQPVKETFKQSEYAGWKIDDVDMLARAGMETIYVIEVEQGKQEVDLYYSPEGVLTRTEVDNDSDYYEDFIPQPDLDDFSALIKEMYPNARILDIEKEKDYMEVSIWDENKEKDVYFDSKKTWVGTSWDVRASELPQAVKQAVNARYSGFTIDDAEYVQTPVSEEWYIIDLENKSTDEEVENLRIKADGTWIK